MTSMFANSKVYLRALSVNKRHQCGPLIGIKLRTHAQCALASRKQAQSIGSSQQDFAKYSDYVAITAIKYLHIIS